MRRSEGAVLVGIVVAAGLLLRCGFVATADVVAPLRADAGQYAQYAHNLLAHGTYSLSTEVPPPPDSFRSPGYPCFLAACRWLAGESGWYPLARWLQALLGGGLVWLSFALARGLLPFAASLGVAAFVALSPHLVAAGGYVLTESLFAFALTAAMLLLAAAQRAGRARAGFAAAGLAFGLAALVNESAAPLPLLLAAWHWRRWGRRRALVFAAAALLPLGAWAARNASQPLACTGGDRALATLSHGSYPGLFFATEQSRGYPYREDPEQPAFGASWPRFRAVLAQRVAERPLRHLSWYLVEKPVWLWSWDVVQGAGGVHVYPVRGSILDEQPVLAAAQAAFRWLHLPFCLCAVAGVFLSLRRAPARAPGAATASIAPPLAIALLWSTFVGVLFMPDPRYLVPLRPVQAVLAAAAVVWLAQRRAARAARISAQSDAPPARVPEPVGAACADASD
jgi:4-amino-4-deoxy-L-arabinose transferase-like glycosyltransferase